MSENIVQLPIDYFPDPSKGKPIFNGQIFVGEPDLDPEILANRKDITARQEDGTLIPISPAEQPVPTSAGGVPTYNGSTVQILVDGNYSVKVLNSQGVQQYFFPNYFDGTPIVAGDDHNLLGNREGVGAHDQIYRRSTTIAEINSGVFSIGDLLSVSDRDNASFNVELGGTPNGYTIIDAGGGNTAILIVSGPSSLRSAGGVGDGVFDNTPVHEALQDVSSIIEINSITGVEVFNFSSPPTIGPNLTTVLYRDDIVTGVTHKELNGIIVDRGSVFGGGSVIVDSLRDEGSIIDIVGGSLRQQVAAPITIARTGSTATATKAAHGYSIGDLIVHAGADQDEYNGPFNISNATANTYDFTVAGTPATPATGSPMSRKPAQWDWIIDSDHIPVGVDTSQPVIAVGSSIIIPTVKTYSRIVSGNCVVDETLANAHQLVIGPSIGVNSIIIKGAASLHGAAEIYYDGIDWIIVEGTGQSLNFTIDSSSTGTGVIVNHDYCPSVGYNINAFTVGGAINPFTPLIRTQDNNNVTISFQDPFDGSLWVSPSFDTRMAFTVNKVYHEGVLFDGTGDSWTWDLSDGNVWFELKMEI